MIKKLDSDIENELRDFGYESRGQGYLGLERKHTGFKKNVVLKNGNAFGNSIKNFKLTDHSMRNQK